MNSNDRNRRETMEPDIQLKTYSRRVLEPLCQATKTILEPLDLMPQDYLLIGVDDEVKRFIIRVATLREVTIRDVENEKRILACPDGIDRVVDDRNPSWSARVKFLRRIPERKQLGMINNNNNKWTIAATDFSVLVMHHGWPKERMIFGEQAKVLYELILTRFLAQSHASNLVARFKVDGYLPDMPPDFIDHPERPLSPYQKVSLLAQLNQPSYALFWEQGTGKTPAIVARINLEGHRKESMYRALVVCPNQVRRNWGKEFERFSVYPGKISELRGGQIERVRRLTDGIREEDDCQWSACIVSIDSIPSMWDAIKLVPWDLVVYDESHYTKNPNTTRFKYLKKFAQFPHIKQRVALTGTPIGNSIMDLWAQFELMGEGLSGFVNYKNYRAFHGKYKRNGEGNSVSRLIGLKNVPLVQERLARITFLMTKKEANLDLPDKLYDIAEVDMTTRQYKIYKDIATRLIYEIEEELKQAGTNKRITTQHILTKLLRLAQITSGHVAWDKDVDIDTLQVTGGGVEQIDKENPKVKYIIEQIQDPDRDPNGKMIIWACFVEDLRIVSHRLAELGINHVGYHRVTNEKYRVKDSVEAEYKLNFDDDCRILLANPQSAGIGQNFLGYDKDNPDASTMYVDREIFMSCNWSALQRSQAEDRAHRRDARAPGIRITDLIVSGTIDEEIRDRLKYKKQMALEIQDIREILKKVVRK